jgi:hypothetical protein
MSDMLVALLSSMLGVAGGGLCCVVASAPILDEVKTYSKGMSSE